MTILFILSNDNSNGGAVGIMRQVAEYYLLKNNDVHVLFLKDKHYGHWECLKSNYLHLYYGGTIFKFIGHIHNLRKITFDCSFSTVVKFTALTGVLRRVGLLHIKNMVARESTSVFQRFSGFVLLYYKFLYNIGYHSVDILICQTNFMKKQLLDAINWLDKSAKVVVLSNPVNIPQMIDKGKEDLCTLEYQPYIVTAGRFIYEKGYDILLDSFSKIIEFHPELKLLILGDGILRTQIEGQIDNLQLRGKVVLLGNVANVYPWFKHALLCVVSSRLEGFPNVLLQMMSQSTKVVSTLCAGDIDKIDGLVTCPPNSSKALFDAIMQGLEINDTNHRELFDKELERRSIDNFMKQIEILYKG